MTDTLSRPTPAAPPDPPSGRQTARPSWPLLVAIAVIVAIVGGIGLAGAAVGRSTKTDAAGTVTVSATGTVMGVPDTVEFTVGVQTTRASAPLALRANDQATSRLESSLKRAGVPLTDDQTSGLNIWEDTNRYGQVTGFTVQDTLDVTLHKATGQHSSAFMQQAGTAIEVAAKSAGSGIQFNGVTLSLSNDVSLLATARERAMRAALAAATSDASGGGTTVGAIVKITDQESGGSPNPIYYRGLAYASSVIAAPYVPLRAGTQPVTVQVTVVYALG